MNLHANLNHTVHMNAADFVWQPSPLAGVQRMMLDRVGDEVAVATSLVRYAPGSYFDPHSHALGEEFLVLDGVFSDEHGDYPAGTYVRNPPGSRHRPHSEPGCTIFVKLRQFDDADLTPVITSLDADGDADGDADDGWHTDQGARRRTLYRYGAEEVSVVRIPAGVRYAFHAHYHVRELLVVHGQVTWQQAATHTLNPWSWIRMHPGEPLRVIATRDSLVFSKTRPVYRPAEG